MEVHGDLDKGSGPVCRRQCVDEACESLETWLRAYARKGEGEGGRWTGFWVILSSGVWLQVKLETMLLGPGEGDFREGWQMRCVLD